MDTDPTAAISSLEQDVGVRFQLPCTRESTGNSSLHKQDTLLVFSRVSSGHNQWTKPSSCFVCADCFDHVTDAFDVCID